MKVIRPGRAKDYFDFWNRGVTANEAGEHLHSDMLSFTVMIEVRSKAEAMASVRKQHPDHTIDDEATESYR